MKTENHKLKIVFFGTSEFAISALETLVKESYNVVAVITTPDEPAGRKQILTPSPVKTAAQKLGLKILQPEKLKNGLLAYQLTSLQADIGIIAAYGKIIPKEIIDLFPHGLLNIHPSLLPKYRGPTPIQSALLNGETETGITIMILDQELDHGPLLAQQELRIMNYELYESLSKRLAETGAELLIKTLPDYLSGKIKPQEQDHARATFTRKFSRQDGKIDWHQPAEKTLNRVRALNPEPGTWTTLKLSGSKKDKILKIVSASFDPKKSESPAGSALIENGHLYINAPDGRIVPETVQLEGRHKLKTGDFLRGLKLGSGQLDFQ